MNSINENLRQSLARLQRIGKATGVEHMEVLSPSGTLIKTAEGNDSSVALPWDFQHKVGGFIVCHYHPSECPVSLTDCELAAGHAVPCYAITTEGTVTWATGKSLAAAEIGNYRYAMALDFLGPNALGHVQERVTNVTGWQTNFKSAPKGMDALHYGIAAHFTNIALDSAGLLEYRFCPTREIEQLWDEIAEKIGASKCRDSRCFRAEVTLD